MKRTFPLLIALALIGAAGWTLFSSPPQASSRDQTAAKAHASRPEVMMYLHSGTDRTGQILGFDGKTFQLKTATGIEAIPRKSYQGMVLNTPTEKKISEKFATDAGAYMDAGKYTFEFREGLKKQLAAPPSKCLPLKKLPCFHFLISDQQHIQNAQILVPSSCPELDQSLLKTIQNYKPQPLPQTLEVSVFPMNYFYEPPGFVYDPKADKRPHPKHPDDIAREKQGNKGTK